MLRPQGQGICAQADFILSTFMYVGSRRYKVYVLTKILLTFKYICAQETFYQKFLGVPTVGVNTKTRRRISKNNQTSMC